jgi:NAD(P)-dependent dehydrogenase (short-subunit alcohol dehydrogenase family)
MTRHISVVLVTGTSSGFGRAIAQALHGRGYLVYGTARKADGTQNPYGDFRLLSMDVTSDVSVDTAVEAIRSREGRIDAVINNAGNGIAGAIEETSNVEAQAQLETNFFGMHRVCKAVLPIMRAQKSGRIINVSSLAGLVAIPFQGFYSASKFAIEGYTEALRMEVRSFGIKVSMIEPGDFATSFTSNRRMTAASSSASAYQERCARAVAQMAADEGKNIDISPVVRTIIKALESPAPRLRYPVANALQRAVVALRPFMPASLFEYLIADAYKLR